MVRDRNRNDSAGPVQCRRSESKLCIQVHIVNAMPTHFNCVCNLHCWHPILHCNSKLQLILCGSAHSPSIKRVTISVNTIGFKVLQNILFWSLRQKLMGHHCWERYRNGFNIHQAYRCPEASHELFSRFLPIQYEALCKRSEAFVSRSSSNKENLQPEWRIPRDYRLPRGK